MDLAIILGLAAFLTLGVMVALLWLSSRKETSDPVTQEIIVRAQTGPIIVNAAVEITTQEDKD